MKSFGCIKSELDGSEYIYKNPLKTFDVPEKYSYQSTLPKIINQGNQNICVACSLDCYLNWYQNLLKNTPKVDNNFNIKYEQMQSSGIQIKQALTQLLHDKNISAYFKIPNLNLAKIALIINGPLIVGLPVYDSTINNFWNGSKLEGYHAVSIVGFNTDGFIIRNSWGTSYGKNGYHTISYSDAETKFIELWTMTN